MLRRMNTTRWASRGLLILGLSILALLLVACAPSRDLTVEQSLFDTQSRYVELGAVAAAYVALPYCEPVPLVRCADESTVKAIQRADREVYNVLKAAEAARGTPDEAQYRALAVSALSRLRMVVVREALQ